MAARISTKSLFILCVFLFIINISGGHAVQLCCPYGHLYQTANKQCERNLHQVESVRHIPIYDNTHKVKNADSSTFNIIGDFWCRTTNNSRPIFTIDDVFYIQNNSKLFIPEENNYFDENSYCLGWIHREKGYKPIFCGIEDDAVVIARHFNSIGNYALNLFLFIKIVSTVKVRYLFKSAYI